MNLKGAAIRAVRTFAQTFAGALIAFPIAASLSDIRAVAEPVILALYTAGLAAVVSFLQNVVEDSTPLEIPKDQ